MKRLALGGFAVLVLVAVAALVITSRSSSEARGPARTAPPEAQRLEPSGDPGGADPAGERPRLDAEQPAGEGAPALAELTAPREYVRDDGIAVRDHRSGDKAPNLTKQIARPRKAQRIDAALMVSVKNAVRPHVTACTDQLPDDAFGADPRVQGEVIVSIADDQVRIDKLNLQLNDVRDDGLTDCVRQAVAGVSVPSDGHESLEAYTLTLPFRIRR